MRNAGDAQKLVEDFEAARHRPPSGGYFDRIENLRRVGFKSHRHADGSFRRFHQVKPWRLSSSGNHRTAGSQGTPPRRLTTESIGRRRKSCIIEHALRYPRAASMRRPFDASLFFNIKNGFSTLKCSTQAQAVEKTEVGGPEKSNSDIHWLFPITIANGTKG